MKKIILLLFVSICFYIVLLNNKTFFTTTYIGIQNQNIYIPKYSYFKSECCMTAATFISLKSKKELEKDINNYLKDFNYFEDDSTYGYQKDDLFIQSYEVEEKILYRKIIIVYYD